MAIFGSAIVGAVASTVVGGLLNSGGSSSAASDQVAGNQAAIAEQQREFDYVQNALGPQRNLGYGAMSLLQRAFGMNNLFTPQSGSFGGYGLPPSSTAAPPAGAPSTPSSDPMSPFVPPQRQWSIAPRYTSILQPNQNATVTGGVTVPGFSEGNQVAPAAAGGGASDLNNSGGSTNTPIPGQPDYSGFFNSPGYQFTQKMGAQAINRGAAARGDLYSTSTLANLNDYSQGLASTHYNDYINQLLQMAGLGSAATSNTTNAAVQTGNNISAGLISQGNANASGALGTSGAWSNVVNRVGNTFSDYLRNNSGGGYSYGPSSPPTSNPYGDSGAGAGNYFASDPGT